MTSVTKEELKKIVKEVLGRQETAACTKSRPVPSRNQGPRVLIVFHAGVRKLDEALNQSRLIEEAAGKNAVFTGESARSWVCKDDMRKKMGARCILDTVKPDGLEKVLERSDYLVLPTLCLKVAARVAHLTCDNQESSIVLSALLQGKKVLASNDGFLLCDILVNEKIREEIKQILSKLEGFGMVFCSTDQLSAVFQKMEIARQNTKTSTKVEGSFEEVTPALRLITAKAIYTAVNNKQSSIRLAPGGNVTPLARDLAKEYSIKIIEV